MYYDIIEIVLNNVLTIVSLILSSNEFESYSTLILLALLLSLTPTLLSLLLLI